MKRRIVLGFLIATILLTTLIVLVGHEEVAADLAGADPLLLGISVCSGVLALTFRGMVWGQFLRTIDETMSGVHVAGVFLSAMFIKYVTPYGQVATEPFVAYLVARDADMAYEDGLAGILSADVFNYIPYYTFGFIAIGWIVFSGTLGADILNYIFAFVGLFVTLSVLAYVVVRQPVIVYRLVLGVAGLVRGPVDRLTTEFGEKLSPAAVRDRLDNFYQSIDLLATDRRIVAYGALYAHLGMLFLMLPVYFGGLALGHELALPVVVIAVAFGKLGSFVPAPGGLGGVEGFVTASLMLLGSLEPAAALSVALIYRVSTYWLTIVVGGVGTFAFVVRR
ncbi:lysylphosphatidylglycerol synthase transmembrane domain-containing protein [Halovivax gelatinilyticus]|uniref:lysylphosphatidylglycerol synthase transmembrane domain-containing protein n=1 Tax=Halovivax gelatinilyticus TaxID=2961597 RepID=UPI0020CA463B|nr:lysylphosphatidylglycerol synthase transmembrane domain-containing protein [Halovivax gelatinilyticus]